MLHLTARHINRIIISGVAILTLCSLLSLGSASAIPEASLTVIEVTTEDDEFDSSGGGIDCSLREAIQTANNGSDFGGCVRSGSGALAIIIPEGTYILIISGIDEDDNASGDLDIRTAMSLYGASAEATIIQAQAGLNDRVFHIVQDVASDYVVTMWDLSITGGHRAIGDGGGVLNEESLWISRVSIHHNATMSNGAGVASNPAHTGQSFRAYLSSSIYNNSAGYGLGGGIYISTGELILDHVEMAGGEAIFGGGLYLAGGATDIAWTKIHVNKARGDGGGIYLTGGAMTLADSSIYYNSTDGDGGNIYINSSSDEGTIDRCYIGEGQALGFGAGIYNAGDLMISSSTIAQNKLGQAAGIYHTPITASGVMLTILDSTVSNNNTTAPPGQLGEGLYNAQNLTDIEIRNTIFSGNGNYVSYNDNCFSTNPARLVSLGYNLDSGDSCGFTQITDLTDTDPLLGELSLHDGFSLNYALDVLSPALETGGDCLATDQRGLARPMDQNRDGTAYCDIGAYEAEPYDLPPYVWLPFIGRP